MMFLVILSGLILGFVNYKDSEKLAIDIIKRNNQAEIENISEYYFDKLIFDMEFIVETWAESPDIINYKNSSNAAIDYRNLADEFLEEEAEREW